MTKRKPHKPKPKPLAKRIPRKAKGPRAKSAAPEARSAPTAALMEAQRPALGPAPVKVPLGRPPEYDPKFCDLLLEHMAQGFSFESFAGVIGVCKKTLYNWTNTKEYAPFLHAKDRGSELCRLWWEKLGIQGVQGLGPRVLSKESEEAVEVKGQPVFDAQGNPIMKMKREFSAAQFVPGTWFRNMTNRFPEEWRDRHELTGKDGKDLLPPIIPWDSMVGDPHVQQFLAERQRMMGGGAPTLDVKSNALLRVSDAIKVAPQKPARKAAPKVEPMKTV